ncbi:MAG: hypothetical protein ACBR12_14305 [Microcoleus sp.]
MFLILSAAQNQKIQENQEMLDFIKSLWREMRQPIVATVPLYALVMF